jgi:DNA repair protein RadC
MPETEKFNDIPHYHGHRKRLKERFTESIKAQSTSAIPDYEIVELLLFYCLPRRDVKQLAKEILSEYGSFTNLLTADFETLLKDIKIPQNFLTLIKTINEASLRMLKEKSKEKTVLSSWQSLLDYCKVAMGFESKEQFRIIFLDQKNKIIADEIQQKGTVDETPVYPREVVKRALFLNASSVIVAHNHPSGDASPSKADIEITEQIEKALNAVDIKLHDHLIIAKDKHFSFAGNGLIG